MTFDDIKEKYRGAPLWARLAAMAVIGLFPAAYIYMEDSEVLGTQLSEATGIEEVERQKFETARGRKANLPKLEEQLAFTEEQLVKAKKSLPDAFRIEDILERTATIAKESGIKLEEFRPGKEKAFQSPSQYAELAISTKIEGHFAQVAAFLDRIVHLESSIFVKNLDLARVEGGESTRARDSNATTTPYREALAARQGTKVSATFNLVAYRALTDQEAAVPTSPPPPGGVPLPGGVPPPGQGGGGE